MKLLDLREVKQFYYKNRVIEFYVNQIEVLMEIAILVVLLYLSLFTVYTIGSKLSFNRDNVIYNIIAFLIQPFILLGIVFLYVEILGYLGYGSKESADISIQGIVWFLGLSVLFILGGFSPRHTTKSGKADKRYKENPATAGGPAAYLLGLFIYIGIFFYILTHIK